ncbi:MAG: methionyl-tRNA formyltransferase [Synergistaceae bacterium]|jgi:methionyl-tRNA formyltransferase|nr:methionyl-tRNA formyltransferase [Synergistaceae bacterium]
MGRDVSLRYAYFGSGTFAARCLELLGAWRTPSWVVTAPSRPSGRGRKESPTPVGDMMRSGRFGSIPLVETPDASSCGDVLALKERIRVDFIFVVDFGQIVREPVLALGDPVGCLNIHPSLLPLYRGAAPIQRALMDGADETGVTVFKLVRGMDSGPILLQEAVPVTEADDCASLRERAARTGVGMFVRHASANPIENWSFTPQDESRATRAPKITPDEERIDWSRPSAEIAGKIRALSPKPGAWTTMRGRRVRVLSAEVPPRALCSECAVPGELDMGGIYPLVWTGDGAIVLCTLQAEGKKIQSAADWKNGLRAAMGECLV